MLRVAAERCLWSTLVRRLASPSWERSNEAGDEVPVQEPGLPPGPQLGPATGSQSRAVAVALLLA
jgi:hypothetical protein